MMSVPPTTEVGAGVQARLQPLLVEHHRALETACQALLAQTYGDDPRELIFHYRTFERATLEHLAAEEDLLLPAYAERAPDDAGAIRGDHAAIRQLLFRVGIDVELHIVRVDTVKRLIETLQTHAAHEDAAMYPWAQDNLPLSLRRQLFVRIGRSLRSLIRQRPSAAS
jgi:hypothetical protein